MKYIGLISLVFASALVSSVTTQYIVQESGHNRTNDTTPLPEENNKDLLKILFDIQKQINKLEESTVPEETDPLGERQNGQEPVAGENSELLKEIEKNNPELAQILNTLEATQQAILAAINKKKENSLNATDKIIINQKQFIETVKDVQWEQTPRHVINLYSLDQLDKNIYKSEQEMLAGLLSGFPLEVNLLSTNLDKMADKWNYRKKENWELLMNPANNENVLKGAGIFHLHLSVKDFIDNRTDATVQNFLKDITGRTQLILYHQDWQSFIELFQKSNNASYFEKYAKVIRLDIGSHALSLKNCRSKEQILAFLKMIRKK